MLNPQASPPKKREKKSEKGVWSLWEAEATQENRERLCKPGVNNSPDCVTCHLCVVRIQGSGGLQGGGTMPSCEGGGQQEPGLCVRAAQRRTSGRTGKLGLLQAEVVGLSLTNKQIKKQLQFCGCFAYLFLKMQTKKSLKFSWFISI